LENRRAEPTAEADDSGAGGGGLLRLPRLFGTRDNQPKRVELPAEQERVTYTLADYQHLIRRPDFAELVHSTELQLVQLSYRSFPLYRPLIKHYLALIADLKEGKTDGADAAFATLAHTRAGLLRSGQMAEDVLNLYEATEIDHTSGAFDEYKELAERLRRSKPECKDEISKYLDRIQAEHR